MFRTLLAHLLEAPQKRHLVLVYCVCVMSGSYILINGIKSASRWFHYTDKKGTWQENSGLFACNAVCWVSGSRRFGILYCLHLKGQRVRVLLSLHCLAILRRTHYVGNRISVDTESFSVSPESSSKPLWEVQHSQRIFLNIKRNIITNFTSMWGTYPEVRITCNLGFQNLHKSLNIIFPPHRIHIAYILKTICLMVREIIPFYSDNIRIT
jgi:hypothetical protein